jgi:2-keto-4-pentenoate hydratase
MIDDVAARLRRAEAERRAIEPVRGEVGTIGAAYKIQQANISHRMAAGHRPVGRKVGLTSKTVQKQLGVDQPDFGLLFDRMEIAEGGRVDLAELIQPKIEAEIAFLLARDLDRPSISQREVIAATECIFPCLEIVDSRILNWEIDILDTVADNASSARFVVGAVPRRLTDFDFVQCGMTLRENGEVKSLGVGVACLGNPIEAMRWLAQTLSGTDHPLRAGDIVLSGALGPMIPMQPGLHYEGTIAGLGNVRVNTMQSPT